MPLKNITRIVTYPHPPRRVWQALTDPDALTRWFLPPGSATEGFTPHVGSRFTFTTADNAAPVRGEVLEVDEEKRLAYSWRDGSDAPPSLVVWTLSPAPDGRGTRVHLEHIGGASAPTSLSRLSTHLAARANAPLSACGIA